MSQVSAVSTVRNAVPRAASPRQESAGDGFDAVFAQMMQTPGEAMQRQDAATAGAGQETPSAGDAAVESNTPPTEPAAEVVAGRVEEEGEEAEGVIVEEQEGEAETEVDMTLVRVEASAEVPMPEAQSEAAVEAVGAGKRSTEAAQAQPAVVPVPVQREPGKGEASDVPAAVPEGGAVKAAAGAEQQQADASLADEKPRRQESEAGLPRPVAPAPRQAAESPRRAEAEVSEDDAGGEAVVPEMKPASPPAALRAEARVVMAQGEAVEPAREPAQAPAPSPVAVAHAASPSAVAQRATTASVAQESPVPADVPDTFEQVVLGLRGQLDARNGKAEIRLDPPNLGTLRVSIALDNGALTAHFRTSSDVVRDLLSKNMDQLRSVLERQGIPVDQLAVRTENSSGQQQQAGGEQRSAGQANPDGRGNQSSGQDARQQGRSQREASFATVWQQVNQAPVDLVA